MALKHLAAIAGALQQHGRKAGEPVAVVSQATLPAQVVLETTLGRCAEDAAAAGIEPPCIVVVGEVVRLRAGLDWQGLAAGRELEPNPLGARRQEIG
jgi:uroporphyrin-III C-methyltransferase